MAKEKSAHWYRADGSACHTQPTKSKTAKNPTRPTNITDAKAQGLFPSVTTIISILDKPQLQDWKNEQVAKAGLALCRRIVCFDPNVEMPPEQIADIALLRDPKPEGDEALMNRIIDAAFQQVEDAKDAGEQIHAAAGKALLGREYDEDEGVFLPELDLTFPMKTFIRPVVDFVHEHGIEAQGSEVPVVNLKEGYAGTMDLPMRCKKGFGPLDFKSRKTKPHKPVFAYDEQPMQIASYHAAHWFKGDCEFANDTAGVNLFISTTEPGRVDAVWYDAATIRREWEAFRYLCGYWRIRKGYDPRKL
jgi:hypothetical protein